jgi:hypothetical protein
MAWRRQNALSGQAASGNSVEPLLELCVERGGVKSLEYGGNVEHRGRGSWRWRDRRRPGRGRVEGHTCIAVSLCREGTKERREVEEGGGRGDGRGDGRERGQVPELDFYLLPGAPVQIQLRILLFVGPFER